jgi:hypothetical protein
MRARLSQKGPDDPENFPEEVWRDIEAKLGLTAPNPALRQQVAQCVSDLQVSSPDPDPRPAEVRKWLVRVQRNARRLLSDLDFPGTLNNAQWRKYLIVTSQLRLAEQRLVAELNGLIKFAERRLADTPRDKGGRQPNPFSWSAIYQLATIFHSVTGRVPTITFDAGQAPYKGAFFSFVMVTFRHLAPEYGKPNQALGKMIQRVLQVWRKNLPKKDKTAS